MPEQLRQQWHRQITMEDSNGAAELQLEVGHGPWKRSARPKCLSKEQQWYTMERRISYRALASFKGQPFNERMPSPEYSHHHSQSVRQRGLFPILSHAQVCLSLSILGGKLCKAAAIPSCCYCPTAPLN